MSHRPGRIRRAVHNEPGRITPLDIRRPDRVDSIPHAGHVYYLCERNRRQHQSEPWFDDHPAGVRLRADRIEPLVHDFFTTHVPATKHTAPHATANSASPTDPAAQATRAAQQQIAALQHRQNRLIEELEVLDQTQHDPPDVDALRANIYRRFTELNRQIDAKNAELAALADTNQSQTAHRAETTALADAPLEAQRAVFDAHHLTVLYDCHARSVTVTAIVEGKSLTEKHNIEGVRRRDKSKHEPS